MSRLSGWIQCADEVAEALAAGRGVVALETTLLTHGLPWPVNLETAARMEQAVRSAGAVPATVGLIDGRVHVGLDAPALERLARGPGGKIQARGLPLALAARSTGGTTVSATMQIAAVCGIRVFATGGIGGVHRQVARTGDVSEDLLALSRHPVAVVSSGAKAILDVPRTLEALETLGVPVIGVGTGELPAFYYGASGLPIAEVPDLAAAAGVMRAAWHDLGARHGLLVCSPPPPAVALPAADVEAWIGQALGEAEARGLTGAGLTPFLLASLDRLSGGATVRTNGALAESNARLAGALAAAYVAHLAGVGRPA
jgi:pseudouridylate synthase